MTFTPGQQTHVDVMRAVLAAVRDTRLVLKGGTALLLCYDLDRFSEDLDFDAPKKFHLESRLGHAVRSLAQSVRLTRTKDTETVQRYRIEYVVGGTEGRLKVEVSCRDAIDSGDVVEREGIRTYRAARLVEQKIAALEGRTAARDLYDVHFLVKNFRAEFGQESAGRLRNAAANLNELEARFRPAFEEDDLFRHQAGLLSALILEIQESLA